jgi:hypothetical protein
MSDKAKVERDVLWMGATAFVFSLGGLIMVAMKIDGGLLALSTGAIIMGLQTIVQAILASPA